MYTKGVFFYSWYTNYILELYLFWNPLAWEVTFKEFEGLPEAQRFGILYFSVKHFF